MLEVHDLHVSYGAAPALWGVSMRVQEGEILCVVGPNGAGKTTLVNTLAGILRARAGQMTINGIDLIKTPIPIANI